MTTKGPDAFRTISEAADELGVPQHVLRFWETKFSFIRPMKRAGGRRFYRRQDIEVLRGVRRLLHEEGYTIKGVQRLHKEHGVRRLVAGELPPSQPPVADHDYTEVPEAPEAFEAAETSEIPDIPQARDHPPVLDLSERPTLSGSARDRLQAVLRDLESTKGRIDALLGEGADPRA